MAKPRRPRLLADVVDHILSAIEQIESFTAGMDLTVFESDKRTLRAVERCLEIISEASRDIPDAVKAEHSQINWRAMADAGNLYRHGYEHVQVPTLWETLRNNIQPLKRAILDIKKDHVK